MSTHPKVRDLYVESKLSYKKIFQLKVFLWYAIQNKLKPLIIEYCLWIVAQSLVVLLILAYR